jgi:hypothetical protein
MSNYPPPPPGQPPYPPPPGGQPPYPPHGQMPYPQAQPPKKGGGLKWVLIGCGGFILVGIIAVVAIGWFGYYKAKQAGFDPELMKRNPALAAAKLAIGLDKDKELVSIDETSNTLTVKDKKSGKTVTLTFEQDKNGHIIFKEKGADGKETSVTVKGDGDKGSITIDSPDGKTKIGNDANFTLPDWLPRYPGAQIEGTYSAESSGSENKSFRFVTDDSPDQVVDFYEKAFKSAGLKVTKTTTQQDGKTTSILSANDDGYKRFAGVSVSVIDGDTNVTVTAQSHK